MPNLIASHWMYRWRPWLFALALWLTLACVSAVALWHQRNDAIANQSRELGLLSSALTDGVERGLEGAEEGLTAIRAELRNGRLPLDVADADTALRTRADLIPLVQALWLVDLQGRKLLQSHDGSPPDLASFEPALDQLAPGQSALSRPFKRNRDSALSVAIALPFDSAGGHPGGWIVAAMPASSLLGAFGAIAPADDMRLWGIRRDGARLAGAHTGPAQPDEASLAQNLKDRPALAMRTFRDGSVNLVGLHTVAKFAVTVVLSRDLAAVLKPWHQMVNLTVSGLAVLFLLAAGAVVLIERTERRHAQAQQALRAQVARAGRLESLGTLAGGVAHDFNNVLAGILGYGEMARDAAIPDSKQARHLDRVLQAALRGKALVERILAFSRGAARESSVFELETIVEDVLSLLSASLRPGIVLEHSLEAPGARLRGDAIQAFEAVMNLCTNALQAMPQGGMLSVQLQRSEVREKRVLSHTVLTPGTYLVVSVTDQGMGITDEVMDHLFEPFFTTRAAESGTGLGLAVVFGAMAEFNGAVDVRSTPGRGACFTLYFPESSDALPVNPAASDLALRGSGQRVMVVDDQADLVDLSLEMLQDMGYAPVGFSGAQPALAALLADPKGFVAVISDEVMPGMSGTQLTQALRKFAPDLPVLLVSGYGGALLAQRAAQAGVSRVLTKPLERADLSRALAELVH